MAEHGEAQLRHTLLKGTKRYDPGVLEEFQANSGEVVARAPGFAERQKGASRVVPLCELVRGWQP